MTVPLPSVLGTARLELTVPGLGDIAAGEPDAALRELIAVAQEAERVVLVLVARGWTARREDDRILLIAEEIGEADARAQVESAGGTSPQVAFSSAAAPDLAMFTDAGNRAVAAAADELVDTYAPRLIAEAEAAALSEADAQLLIAASLGFLAARERADQAGLQAPGLEHLTGLLARAVITALSELADIYPEALDSEPREMALTHVGLRLGLNQDDL